MYAPTAQVATQQGVWLARYLGQLAKKEKFEAKLREIRSSPESTPEAIETAVKHINKHSKLRPFHYSHQGSLAWVVLVDVCFRA